jgi:hypothetical protein
MRTPRVLPLKGTVKKARSWTARKSRAKVLLHRLYIFSSVIHEEYRGRPVYRGGRLAAKRTAFMNSARQAPKHNVPTESHEASMTTIKSGSVAAMSSHETVAQVLRSSTPTSCMTFSAPASSRMVWTVPQQAPTYGLPSASTLSSHSTCFFGFLAYTHTVRARPDDCHVQ